MTTAAATTTTVSCRQGGSFGKKNEGYRAVIHHLSVSINQTKHQTHHPPHNKLPIDTLMMGQILPEP